MSENQSILLEKGLDQVLKSIGLVKDEITFLIDNGYEDYLEVMNEKFSYSKTFLHRENNLNFKEIFFPISVINHKRRRINYSEILNLFKHKTKCTSLIGEAGSGKSMLARYLFLNSLKKDFRIPILIELRNFNNENISFNDKVHRILNNNNLAPNILIINRLLKKGRFVFILDGFDEINTSVKTQLVNDIDNFIDKFNDNYFIITSRYNSGLNSIPRFENHYIKSLSKKQIDEYIDVQCYLLSDNELAIKLKKTISNNRKSEYLEYLKSPLLLSMFIYTFKNYPELPTKRSKFYWNIYDTLANKHDTLSKKGGFLHERKSKLKSDEIETILEWFAFLSIFDETYEFSQEYLKTKLEIIKNHTGIKFQNSYLIYDLSVSISILKLNGLNYIFPHKSMQEYFCAKLIASQLLPAKKQIYQELLPKYFNKKYNDLSNIFLLLDEIDAYYFTGLFIIPTLEKYLNKLKRDKTYLKNFYSIFNPTEILPINKDFETTNSFNTYSIEKNVFFNILNYINLKLDWKFSLNKIKAKNDIGVINYLFDNYYTTGNENVSKLFYKDLKREVFAELKNNFNKVLIDNINQIEIKVNLLKEIQEENSNKDSNFIINSLSTGANNVYN